MSRERYARQLLLPGLGEAGQSALADASVTIIGCGGLGTLAAAYIAGAGVGHLRLVDGDRVELSNLHRQLMFREEDIGRNKAEALATALLERNSDIHCEPEPARASAEALPALIEDADLVLDCCDNFPTRYAINAGCVAQRKSLLTAAAIRREGLVLSLLPGREGHACYHCVFPQDADTSVGERCQDAGVLGPSVGVVASWQAAQAITILTGRGAYDRLWRWDARTGEMRNLRVPPDSQCSVCATATDI